MILFNRDVVFVHNPKTAGTSLLSVLRRVLPPPVHTAGVAELGTFHPGLEAALAYAGAVLGQPPSAFRRVLACVRNPFDRELSMYTYFREGLNKSPSVEADLNDPVMLAHVRRAGELGFGDWLAHLQRTEGSCDIWRSRRFYEDWRGDPPLALRVLRCETLDADLVGALDGLPLTEPLASAPVLNATRHPSRRDAYDPASARIVHGSYGWVFDRFGYARKP